ncbi:MAG: TetR/AcrR family transcriptional regulator [Acidobacteriota bacterium]
MVQNQNEKRQEAPARRQILTAAAREFSDKGFGGARVDAIAARAHVNKATLYYHVGNKEALYGAVLTGVVQSLTQRLQDSLPRINEPEEKLRVLMKTIGAWAERHPYLPRIMLREVLSDGKNLPPEAAQAMGRIFGLLRSILEEGRRSGRFKDVDPVMGHHLLVVSSVLFATAQRVRARVIGMLEADLPPERPLSGSIPELSNLVLGGILTYTGRSAPPPSNAPSNPEVPS